MPQLQLSLQLLVGTMNLVEYGQSRWVAIEKNTGLFALAAEEDAAVERLVRVARTTLDAVLEQGGMRAVRSYLESRGIPYSQAMQTQEVDVELAMEAVRSYLASRGDSPIRTQGNEISSRSVDLAYAAG